MCRLFGMAAAGQPVQATFWLLDAPDSLRQQSHENADGTGVGYFDPDGTPRVDKQPIAAFADRRFAAEARDISSRTFVAHVRHATNGALTMANTHPFCQAGRLFAHNGVIGDVPRLERHLGDDLSLVGGESDSERFFALITAEIRQHDGDIGAGIGAAARWVVRTLPLMSINFVLVTPTGLWALRYPDTNTLYVLERPAGGSGGDPAALNQSSRHGTHVTSEHARDRPVVVVASERLDDDAGWRELHRGELLHVNPELELQSETLLPGPPAHTM